MKMRYVVMVLAVLCMFGILWYLLSIENSPQVEQYGIYAFPVSKDIPKPAPEPTPTYDLPSITLPEPELEPASGPLPQPVPAN